MVLGIVELIPNILKGMFRLGVGTKANMSCGMQMGPQGPPMAINKQAT